MKFTQINQHQGKDETENNNIDVMEDDNSKNESNDTKSVEYNSTFINSLFSILNTSTDYHYSFHDNYNYVSKIGVEKVSNSSTSEVSKNQENF